MFRTLGQKLGIQGISIVLLVAGALVLRGIGPDVPAGILAFIALGIFVFGVVPAWARSISGGETPGEAAPLAGSAQSREKSAP